jgi:hypothetical protein
MTIRELRLLPPLVIGRVGSSREPLDSYTLADAGELLGFRKIVSAETLDVDPNSGEATRAPSGRLPTFKDAQGRIRPVAPFVELFAITDAGEQVPVTLELLRELDARVKVEWSVDVANRKVERRTGDPHDRVIARLNWFSDHEIHPLEGECPNFISGGKIRFGDVRYIKPNDEYPHIRLRFTPAAGLIYGPHGETREDELAMHRANGENPDDAETSSFHPPDERRIYDRSKGTWSRYHAYAGIAAETAYVAEENAPQTVAFVIAERLTGFVSRRKLPPDVLADVERILHGKLNPAEQRERSRRLALETNPPSLYAIYPPAPCWLNDGRAFSRGFLDDTCDGIVTIRVELNGETLTAAARICAGPPAVVPDTLFIRTLSDDLDQAIFGPDVSLEEEPPEEIRARALDVVRRSLETIRFLNVAVANGDSVMGRDALDFDTMPAEEAFQTLRTMRPVFPEGTVDTLTIKTLHQQIFAALQAGAAPWFGRLLRKPTEVGDFTDYGRRKMPALMCGADGSYLALTWRQIDTMFSAASPLPPASETPAMLTPRNRTARARHAELHHRARGNPVSSTPDASVANCTPGLEVDLRAVWRRVFEGIVLREWDNLVVGMDEDFAAKHLPDLTGHRLLAIQLPAREDGTGGGRDRDPAVIRTTTRLIGPSPEDPETRSALLTTESNPRGLAPLEWSNALARVLHEQTGHAVACIFTREAVWEELHEFDEFEPLDTYLSVALTVRPFFENDTAFISRTLAQPGELTQGLCSPWQNDYRECSCYYWASARPDYVNVEPSATGASVGDNWLQHKRTGQYVPDDYVDARLMTYDNLFEEWEKLLRFQIGGRDVPTEPADSGPDRKADEE